MAKKANNDKVLRCFFGVSQDKITSSIMIVKRLKLVRILELLLQLLRVSIKASYFYQKGYVRTLRHGVRLGLNRGFKPYEAFQLGLFDPELPESEISKYCSRARMTEVQLSVNPKSWNPLTEDKGQFYKYCVTIGVPIPKLYAIFFKGIAGWVYNNSVLKSRADWENFFEMELPTEFVIKPALGVYGRGVHIFSKSDKGFVDALGKSYETNDIYELMVSELRYDSFVIQERLKNHPELVRLSGSKTLQTIRMITFIDSDTTPYLLFASLRIATGENFIDNFKFGGTGNLMAEVSQDGVLKSSILINQNSPGIKTLNTHPQTGVSIVGFKLPMWHEACSLVKELALKFLPIRTIGWDIAITSNGVSVVEGNFWYDPPKHGVMDDILAVLLADK